MTKYKIYYNPQIQYPEIFQIKNVMYEVATGKSWNTTLPPKNWASIEIEADTPTQAIKKLSENIATEKIKQTLSLFI